MNVQMGGGCVETVDGYTIMVVLSTTTSGSKMLHVGCIEWWVILVAIAADDSLKCKDSRGVCLRRR